MSNIEQKIQNLLHKIAAEQNLTNYQLKVTPFSSGGANYSSLLFTAVITSDRKDLELFIKVAALSKEMRERSSLNVHETEKLMYTDLKQAYKQLEMKHEVLSEHRHFLSEYYGSDNTPFEEILVLENLAAKGFGSHDRLKSIDWEYASSAAKELAKLHSLSVAFQKENLEEFNRIKNTYMRDWITKDIMNGTVLAGVEHALEVLSGEDRERYRKFADNFDFLSFKKMFLPKKCAVIAHGDYRPCNLLHRNLQDGRVDVVPIDHQTILVGTPITDLLYLIFSGTDKQFRDQNFDRLIDHYYLQFSENLRRLGVDPEETYSKEDYDSELKEKLCYGLIAATYVLPYVTVEADKAPELTSEMDATRIRITKTGPQYSGRIQGVVQDFVRWGVI